MIKGRGEGVRVPRQFLRQTLWVSGGQLETAEQRKAAHRLLGRVAETDEASEQRHVAETRHVGIFEDALLHLAAKLAGDEWHGKLDGEARREGVAKQKLGDETVEPLARVGHLLTVLLPSTEIRVLLRHAHPHTGAALALLRRGVDGAHVR